jgi:hypothetical protein
VHLLDSRARNHAYNLRRLRLGPPRSVVELAG